MSIFSVNHGTKIKEWIRENFSRIQDFAKDHDGLYRDCSKLTISKSLPQRLRGDIELTRTYRIILYFLYNK